MLRFIFRISVLLVSVYLFGCTPKYSIPYVEVSQKENEIGWPIIAEKRGFRYEQTTTPGKDFELRHRWGYGQEKGDFYGYIQRWRGSPFTYAGRMVYPEKDGVSRTFEGLFRWWSREDFSSSSEDYLYAFVEERKADGTIRSRTLDTVPLKNQYNDTCWGCKAKVNVQDPLTKRDLSLLPYSKFVLPNPDELRQALRTNREYQYGTFFRVYSITDALRERGITTKDVTLPAGWRELNVKSRKPGVDAFVLTDYTTDETVILTGWPDGKTRSPLLRLPNTEILLANAASQGNESCFGNKKVLVLTGNCNPQAPAFPLTAFRGLNSEQIQLEVWESPTQRSVFTLTHGFDKTIKTYAWTAEAFLLNEPLSFEQTLAILEGREAPLAEALAQFGEARRDEKECSLFKDRMTQAQDDLQKSPDISDLIADYQSRVDRVWSKSDAYEQLGYRKSPKTDFIDLVEWPLEKAANDTRTHISRVSTYRTLNNSLCEADPKKVDILISALEKKVSILKENLQELDRSLGQQSRQMTKTLASQAADVDAARRRAVYMAALGSLQQSYEQELSNQRQSLRINQTLYADAQRRLQAQADEIKSRQISYDPQSYSVRPYDIQVKAIEPKDPPNKSVRFEKMPITQYTPDPSLGRCVIDFRRPKDDLMVCSEDGQSAQSAALPDTNESEVEANTVLDTGSKTGDSSVAQNGANPSKAPADAKPIKVEEGGAAVCIAKAKNAGGNRTDERYFLRWGKNFNPRSAESAARKDAAALDAVPSCRRSIDLNSGYIVVIENAREDYSGAIQVTFAAGFGPTEGQARADAAEEMARRNWSWKRSDGFEVVRLQSF